MRILQPRQNGKAKWDHLKARFYELERLASSDDQEERMMAVESEAWKEDLTEAFDKYWRWKIENGKLITEQFLGTVRDGKSTAALERLRQINEYLEKKYNKKIDNYRCVASDQIEYLRIGRDKEGNWYPGMKQEICYLIDEFSALGEAGENAMTEMATFKADTDMNAVYHRHRVMCTPSGGHDTNADVILVVMGRNDQEKKTQCKVIYREVSTQQRKTIGHIWINVSKTLKADWYQQYEAKKLRRLELLQTHGYTDIRGPEKKMWTRRAYTSLMDEVQPITKQEGIPTSGDIKLEMENLSVQLKRPLSIVTRDSLVTNIQSMLGVLWTIKKITMTLKNPQKQNIKEELETLLNAKKKRLTKELNRLETAENLYDSYYGGE